MVYAVLITQLREIKTKTHLLELSIIIKKYNECFLIPLKEMLTTIIIDKGREFRNRSYDNLVVNHLLTRPVGYPQC